MFESVVEVWWGPPGSSTELDVGWEHSEAIQGSGFVSMSVSVPVFGQESILLID